MRLLLIAVIIAVCAGNAIAQDLPETAEKEKDPNKWGERLGARIGYVGTTSGLKNAFGAGVNADLHWVQTLRDPFALSFSFGAFTMGSTDRDDITDANFAFQNYDDVSLRITNFSIGPITELKITERMRLHVAGRVGLYTVTVFLSTGVVSGNESDNHLGANGTAGLIYRLTTNWFLDFDVEAHKIWTTSEYNDMVWIYSEGDTNPLFYVINVGVMLRLF